jgi:aspartate kinase
MIGVQGIAGRAFTAVASTENSVSLISQASSEQSICFTLPSKASGEVIAALENEFQAELIRDDIDRIWAMENVVIVTAVGAGMRHTPGVAGQIFRALGDADINIIAIAQGSSEVSISLVVDSTDADESILHIHNLIVNAKS